MSLKLNKHDRYVTKLVNKIKTEYDDISTHQKFLRKKRTIAEVDIIAKRGKKTHLFEVKCSYRIVKAKRQLNKLRKLCGGDRNISLFFYCGMGDRLIEIA